MMHAGDPAKSVRLARLLRFLQAHPAGATTAEVQAWTGSMAPATDVSELRQSGHIVNCRCEGVNGNGRRVYRYTYLGREPE